MEIKKIEFIEKAREIHGDKYDYSKVEYISTRQKVVIICPIHGEFLQLPSGHLTGYKCIKCGQAEKKQAARISNDVFVQRIQKIHGDLYDYSKMTFEGLDKNITIVCKIHGEFTQNAKGHSRGDGCPKCGTQKMNQIEYIIKALLINCK
jgi:predicted nucleic-acid-binding Zn-ribbon protein